MGVPFPCCCSPVGNCDDYYSPTQWLFELNNLTANAAGYANAQKDAAVEIWWYWDAAAALTALNAFIHQFYFTVADLDGPGTIDGTASPFVIGHIRLEDSLVLSVDVTLYAANDIGSKPAEIAFTPYVFTLSDWNAVVRIFENINSNPRSRIALVSLYCDIATDPLPGTLGQLGTEPLFGFDTELAGKYHMLLLRTQTAVTNCGQPLRLDLLGNSAGVNPFVYTGWRNTPSGSLVTATPFTSANSSGTAVEIGAMQHV